jgi:ATP-dependent DNA helicase RecQ
VAEHIVEVDYDTYNVLRLTDASRAVLRGERTIRLRRSTAAPARRRKGKSGEAEAAVDSPLFERLRAWRAAVAKEHGVPAYVVFHDGTLRAIAAARPSSLDALADISGVGEKKLERYGVDLLGLIGSAG